MNKTLFFLDIDGTLIKPDQKPNSTKLPKIIKSLGEKGIIFGLNSNRAIEDIEPIYKMFGLNGPVILENGVYFCKNLTSKKQFLMESPKNLKAVSVKALKSFVKEYCPDAIFEYGDTVNIIEHKKFKSNKVGIYLNANRKFTGSVHLFKSGKRDFDTAKKLSTYLEHYFDKEKLNLFVQYTNAFGNVIFWPKEINKTLALKKLREKYSDYTICMIGDDKADAETRKVITKFFTVDNANENVKQSADYVASKSYTQGVVEILNHLYS